MLLFPVDVTIHLLFSTAADGQHIYLQSTNARCLVKEYGSWEACPDTITAKIVEIEGITMHAVSRCPCVINLLSSSDN